LAVAKKLRPEISCFGAFKYCRLICATDKTFGALSYPSLFISHFLCTVLIGTS
jgi:hypothetical protein